jgi:hypothetical protein
MLYAFSAKMTSLASSVTSRCSTQDRLDLGRKKRSDEWECGTLVLTALMFIATITGGDPVEIASEVGAYGRIGAHIRWLYLQPATDIHLRVRASPQAVSNPPPP